MNNTTLKSLNIRSDLYYKQASALNLIRMFRDKKANYDLTIEDLQMFYAEFNRLYKCIQNSLSSMVEDMYENGEVKINDLPPEIESYISLFKKGRGILYVLFLEIQEVTRLAFLKGGAYII